MNVRAAVFYKQSKSFRIESIQLQKPKPNEVMIKVKAAGVCHSDWNLVTGTTKHATPVVAGHEGSGIVATIGEGVTRVKPGDHVALNWAPNCGDCYYCLHERPSLCETYRRPLWSGTMLDGTTRFSKDGVPLYHFSGVSCFADHVVVPDVACVPLDKEIPLEVAALIGCAVTTGVGAVLNTAAVKPGSSVAVFGAGGVGLSAIMGAKLAGAGQIIAIDTNEAKGDMAQVFGATDVLINSPNLKKDIRALTEGRGVDYAFEAVGLPDVQEQTLVAIRPGGLAVLVGISPMGSATNLPGAVLTRQEKTVTGSYYGSANTARDFPLYADLYRRGKLDLDRLISERFSLDQINEAYEEMLSGETARGIIVF